MINTIALNNFQNLDDQEKRKNFEIFLEANNFSKLSNNEYSFSGRIGQFDFVLRQGQDFFGNSELAFIIDDIKLPHVILNSKNNKLQNMEHMSYKYLELELEGSLKDQYTILLNRDKNIEVYDYISPDTIQILLDDPIYDVETFGTRIAFLYDDLIIENNTKLSKMFDTAEKFIVQLLQQHNPKYKLVE